jgi:serine/threonine protein kinase
MRQGAGGPGKSRGGISLQGLRPLDETAVADEPAPLPPPPLPPPPGMGPAADEHTVVTNGVPGRGSYDEELTNAGLPPSARSVRTPHVAIPTPLPRELSSSLPSIPGEDPTSASDMGDLLDETVVAGRYRIEEPIGEGGMGRVFRVKHRRLDKAFALKLMRTAFSGDTRARALFYREARLASSLSHPNIVSIIDFGEDARLGAFMVMELLDGEPLSVRLRGEGRFPLRQTCEIVMQIAEALHYIHLKQIVHCDIKPDNILLCPVPGTDRRKVQVKLLDFGLARVGIANGKMSAMIDGTPEYMAPERIRGHSPVPSMDIYGLGVLCYEMLTGKLPFRGSIAQVMDAHVRLPPPPISQILHDPIDERAEGLVMKALAKDPAQRQKDMAAFIYELRTLMDMLGFGRRRGGQARAASVATGPAAVVVKDRRTEAAHAGFDLAPLPMSTFDVDGTIVAANRAFAQFLTGDPAAVVEGSGVAVQRLCDIHPGFAADLRAVHAQGMPVQRALRLRTQEGEPVNLMVWLVPGSHQAGDVLVTIHALDV